jgi:uncharacterized protein YecE (DUF72 family)
VRLAALATVLALAACTQVYYKDFVVEPRDRAYSGRAQFDDIRRYLLARKLRVLVETPSFLEVELETQDALRVRLVPEQKVEMTLVRSTKGADFPAGQLERFQEGLEHRLREETGQIVTIRLVGERTRPLTNLQ